MAYSLGLTLYNLANRAAAATAMDRPPRPAGKLVWLHAPGPDSAAQMIGLAAKLEEEHSLNILLTCPVQPSIRHPGVIWQPAPMDTSADSRAMLDHWKPDLVAFSEGELRPALLHEAHERRIPVALVDARSPAILRGREGWWPGLQRGLLGSFSAVLAVDQAAARALRRAGANAKNLQVTGRMEYPSAVLPCKEAERAKIAHIVHTRPVWFAAGLPEGEEAAVIAAHRSAMKLAHRLLLIVSPQDPDRVAALAEQMEQAEGWTVACRTKQEEPDADVQVLIAGPDADFGLWYRLAPITYIGGGLTEVGISRDPMEAAALGSAIIHGPRGGQFGAALGRLAAGSATSLIADESSLAISLGELLSPDRAARLAQMAWAVESDGAEATDKTVAALCKILDTD
ncbi:3-deoxy-D-manno-octulosonic acid transferase [Pseudorhodobacter ferrugineus]|uniref:3-deoxy-D-manno-octulosonic acid transferase n=1 Tax=Pseudorhodobacter ferrugineus TaxID=77008 RepID=UPI0003B409A9|nr:glycosyltransferase N-terminal domain-containing protein [Pseudorhodobacter ferrugineus]